MYSGFCYVLIIILNFNEWHAPPQKVGGVRKIIFEFLRENRKSDATNQICMCEKVNMYREYTKKMRALLVPLKKLSDEKKPRRHDFF